MSNTGEGDQWLCKPCNRRFPTWEALLQHKDYKVRNGSGNHIHCKICGQDYKTQAAANLHMQQAHPTRQEIECPGCGQGPFSRLASLIEHIESGHCTSIDVSVLDDLREKKISFARRLETLTNESVKNNYTAFLLAKSPSIQAAKWQDEQDQGSALGKRNDLFHSTKGNDGPREGIVRTDDGEMSQNNTSNDGKGKAALLSNANLAQGTRVSPVEITPKQTSRPLFQSMGYDDPDHPSFNAARYYSDIMEQYICPKFRCGKCFRNRGGLFAHLRSPAHGERTYRCPCCFKTFKSLAAITSHVESSTVNCRIRDTENYEAYLDQLTAGVVDVGNRNEDGTLRYNIAENAQAALREINLEQRWNTGNSEDVQW